MKTKELVAFNKELYKSVVIDECYSTKDCAMLGQTARELENRGYTWTGTNWVKE